MLGVGLYLALLFSAPWITLTLTLAAYIGSIPFSVRLYQRNVRHPQHTKPHPHRRMAQRHEPNIRNPQG